MKQLLKGVLASLAIFAAASASAQEWKYVNLDSFPLYGTLAPDATEKYSRLPDSLKNQVRKDLWDLGLHSAGMSVRFRSDSPRLQAKWHSRNKFAMNHMTPTGIRGLDLYVLQDDSTWTTVSSARPAMSSASSKSILVVDMEPGKMREYMLYLSLYDGVDSLFIGVDENAVVEQPAVDLPGRENPVVMYGTSILHGGCATRPGMAHTNILQRDLQREVMNLGFSGNARLDPEIARLMATADASVFVVDPLPNCTAAMIEEKMEPFIAILRDAHPATPIMLVESPLFPIMRFNQEVDSTITDKNAKLRAIYDKLRLSDPNLYYFEGSKVLGDNHEATVDNYHLTDMGFQHFADAMRPQLERFVSMHKPIMVGHRGSLYGLENSTESFTNGAKMGFDFLETDFRVTADSLFVCSHDETTERLGGKLTIAESTLDELQAEPLHQTRAGVEYDGRICSGQEYIDICKEYGARPLIELKWSTGINSKDCSNIPMLIDFLDKNGVRDQVIILTSMKPCLEYIRENYPDIELQFLTAQYWPNHFDWCVDKRMDVDIQRTHFNADDVKKFHDNGLKVNVWTCNTPEDFEAYKEMGVDMITTDKYLPE